MVQSIYSKKGDFVRKIEFKFFQQIYFLDNTNRKFMTRIFLQNIGKILKKNEFCFAITVPKA